MDQGRGRPAGGRARGRRPNQQQQPRGPQPVQQPGPQPVQQPGPPPVQQPGPPPVFQAAHPPQQSAWGARQQVQQRAPAPQRGQQEPHQPPPQAAMSNLTAGVQKMSVAGDAPAPSKVDSGRGAGGNTEGRGGIRQRSLDDTHVFKRADLTVKQGTCAREKILVQANYFRLTNMENRTLYQYRVDFQPDEERTAVRKGILRSHNSEFGVNVFDGTVLYTLKKLPNDFELMTQRRDGENIRILVKFATTLSRSDHSYITLLNNMLRKCMGFLKLELIGRHYFDPQEKNDVPEHRLGIWPGYNTSIRQHEDDLLMCCDVTSKVVRQDTVFQLLEECRNSRSPSWKEMFEERILNTTVITPYNNKSYCVSDIDYSSTPMSTFDKKGTPVRYVDYFRERYQINIRNPNQPLLISRPKEKLRITTGDKNIVLIPELCSLTGFTDAMRNDYKLMSAVANYTRHAPQARIQKIENFLTRLLKNPEASTELKNWDMGFEKKLLTFPARVLPDEAIIVAGNQQIMLDRNKGDFNLNRCRLLDPNRLDKWIIMYPSRMRRNEIEAFVQTLITTSASFAFQIKDPLFEPLENDSSQSYVQAIEKAYNKGATLVMCIFMNKREERYSAVKRKCYINRSIPCQVVLAKNVAKNNRSVCAKIGIQLSCKIGGSPWTINVPPVGKMMVVGFDVCHDKIKAKSYGGLVGSINNILSRYCSMVESHTDGTELSNFLPVAFIKLIEAFKRANNNQVPDKIIVYRDGVGEGNLVYTLEHEVESVKKALKQYYPNNEVPMAYIVVSKRINTRLFCNGNNPLPGTVVDSHITLPTMYDFFLVSQSVNQGTVSPTYYNVIYDAIKFKPDHFQRLTYRLSLLYYNYNGPIRTVAPTQYAHKLAFLVGKSLHQEPNNDMNDILYYL